jgi:hypothetical protein
MRPARPKHRHRLPGTMGAAFMLALGAVMGGAVAEAGVTSPYTQTSFKELAPGITHAKGSMRTSAGIQAVQVATIDLRNPAVRLQSLLSNDRVAWLERPSLNADRHSRPGQLAMVATNGDVAMANARGAWTAPHSIHVHQGELMVAPECSRPTLGVFPDGTAKIRAVRIRVRLDMPDAHPRTWFTYVPIKGVNTPRAADEIILYTPRFGPRTLTSGDGTEAVISVSDTLHVSGRLAATVVAIRPNTGNSALEPGQMVLSASGAAEADLRLMWPGLKVSIDTAVLDGEGKPCGPPADELPGWNGIVEAVGGNYYDAKNGEVAAPSAGEYPAGSQSHPRTSVGLTADGRALMVTVDGRQPGYSIGVTLAEMGRLMLQLGAVDAFNLDGGGSTVMAIRQPGAAHITVSDRPSDGRERALTQALVAFSVSNN